LNKIDTNAEEYNPLAKHAIPLPCCFPARQLEWRFAWFTIMLTAEPTQRRMVGVANSILASIEELVDGGPAAAAGGEGRWSRTTSPPALPDPD